MFKARAGRTRTGAARKLFNYLRDGFGDARACLTALIVCAPDAPPIRPPSSPPISREGSVDSLQAAAGQKTHRRKTSGMMRRFFTGDGGSKTLAGAAEASEVGPAAQRRGPAPRRRVRPATPLQRRWSPWATARPRRAASTAPRPWPGRARRVVVSLVASMRSRTDRSDL